MPENQLWYDKYRPKSFDDYVWPNARLREQVDQWLADGMIPSILLAGGPGRGKTTLANLLIDALGVEESDVLRLKGPKDNNAEAMRGKVQEFCELGGWSGIRIVFFDEADVLSQVAQQMLRNIIDDFSVHNVRFIFTCNYPHKLIEPLSQSRLFRIDIEKLPNGDFVDRIINVLVDEGVDIMPEAAGMAIEEAVNICYPDLRRALNLLQNSVRDKKLTKIVPVQSTTAGWEDYLTSLMMEPHSAIREVTKIRETLMQLSPDEIEDVYRFLYHNGTKFFADRQVKAIFIINDGQKVHRSALLPDMILLQTIVRLVALMHDE